MINDQLVIFNLGLVFLWLGIEDLGSRIVEKYIWAKHQSPIQHHHLDSMYIMDIMDIMNTVNIIKSMNITVWMAMADAALAFFAQAAGNI